MLHVVSKGTDASNGKQGRNLILFADICVTYLQGMSFLQDLKFMHYSPQCTSVTPIMRTGYGWTMRRMSSSVLMYREKINSPCVAFPTLTSCVGGSNSRVKNEGDESHLKTVTSFAKFMLLTKLLNHSVTHTALAGATNTVNV